MLSTIERLLDRSGARLLLGSLIVLSVAPLPALRRDWIDWTFFAIFGLELAVRVLIQWRSRRLRWGELAVLLTDAVALVSFLPFLEPFVGARVLRLIRLARLVVLGRFLSNVAGDLRRILMARQMRYQLGFLVAAVLLLTFVGATVLATLEVPIEDFDGDGNLQPGRPEQVLWWTFRQIEDPGNMVEQTDRGALLLVVSLVLTVAGVFVMSFIIGIGTSVVGGLMAAGRRRPVQLRDHTVVVGGGRNVRDVLEDLVHMYGKNRRRARIAVLDAAEEPPAYLESPPLRGVEYRCGEPTSLDAHRLLATAAARRVLVLNDDERGEASDAYAVSAVMALRELNESCPVVVEMRHRRYMSAARVAGGQNVNPVPMGQFLGSLLSHAVMFPGIDAVFEELLTARGSEIYSHIYSLEELRELGECGADELDFMDVLLERYRQDGIIVIGAILGEGEWTSDLGKLVLWLNPLDEPPEEAVLLGARRGRVPCRTLRGIISVARDYSQNRRAALELRRAPARREPRRPAPTRSPGAALGEDMRELRRVLVLGDNESLPALLETTAEFVPSVRFLVAPASRRASDLHDELRRRAGSAVEAEAGATGYPLPRGGSVVVLPSRGDMLAGALEHPEVTSAPIDVAVLLADPHETDPDAGSAFMLLRLVEQVEQDRVAIGARFRIVSESLNAPKGARLETRLGQIGTPPVRVVPTRQMRAYFLVDAAYMPGSERAHLELLSPHGQDFCALELDFGEDSLRDISFADLLAVLGEQDPPVIAFGLKLAGRGDEPGALVLNPEPGSGGPRFWPSEIEVVYAVGETERLSTASRKQTGRQR